MRAARRRNRRAPSHALTRARVHASVPRDTADPSHRAPPLDTKFAARAARHAPSLCSWRGVPLRVAEPRGLAGRCGPSLGPLATHRPTTLMGFQTPFAGLLPQTGRPARLRPALAHLPVRSGSPHPIYFRRADPRRAIERRTIRAQKNAAKIEENRGFWLLGLPGSRLRSVLVTRCCRFAVHDEPFLPWAFVLLQGWRTRAVSPRRDVHRTGSKTVRDHLAYETGHPASTSALGFGRS